MTFDATDLLSVNTIRGLAIDAVEKANSGHPGLPLGAAPMAYVLWSRWLKHDPKDPDWPDRDRFVLSAGHGSALLYALLHLSGYALSLDDLRNFRQWESITPGHPEYHLTPGVAATTGPLGQGSAVAVGLAIAERMVAAQTNRPGLEIVDHFTYALVSDGDLMEGISGEAASLAGHLALGKLVYLYDANEVTLDGPANTTFTEDVAARYAAYGWHVQTVEDGNTDLAAIDAAIAAARAETARPSLIVVRTTIGYGSPNKAGKAAAHGSPLGKDEAAATKQALGLDPGETFAVPDAVRARFGEAAARGADAHAAWTRRFEALRAADPGRAAAFDRAKGRGLPDGWDADLPAFDPGPGQATRESGGVVLNALAARIPWLVGGDADLSSSTKTRIKDAGDFSAATPEGRNIRYGVREHAMGAITNGLLYHGGLFAYCATFLAFSDYMRTPIRLAALDHLPAVFVYTHDSLAVGEDGPTHEPVEQVTALRAIPALAVFRPADANEVAGAWRAALDGHGRPSAMILSRQKVPTLPGTKERARTGVARGAYVLADAEGGTADAIVIATGSEVQLAMGAREALAKDGVRVRVVSMPCMELFEAQDQAYRDSVLPPAITARVAVEAGVSMPWYRWVGSRGAVIGVDRFGASAPGELVLEKYGFTIEHVVAAVKSVLRG